MTSCWLDINYGTVLWTCVWFILQKKNKPRGQQVTLQVLNSARINWESSLNFFEKRIQQCGISGKKKNMSCRFLLKNTPLPMGPWLVNWHHSRVPTNVLSYASDHQCIRVSYLKGSFSLCSVHSMEDYFQKRGINIVRRSQIFSGYKREHHYLFKQINCPFP